MTDTRATDDGVRYLRADDANFEGLEAFNYPPRYVTFEGLRLHYVDVGPSDGPVALLMHGMPTWSFLNRRLIARLVEAGWRCIAADHIGFGRSDKVVDEAWYSIARHVAAHETLIKTLDLHGVTLFCQDWGGPIGLAQAATNPNRFARLVIMNTWLHHEGYAYTPALRQWNAQWQKGGLFATNIPQPLSVGWFMMLPTGRMGARDLFGIVNGGGPPNLDHKAEAVRRGYDAPFAGLGAGGVSGPRRFPLCLPFYDFAAGAGEDQARWFEALDTWAKPIHFIWGGADAVFTEEWARQWASRYSQATFDIIPEAGHFLQDTHGNEIADIFLTRLAQEQR